MAELDINEVARRSGVSASALRYYDQQRLIRSIGRRGLRRVFDAGVLERLALIALGREAGFSLQEIGRLLTAESRTQLDRRMLADKAQELDQTIRRLGAMRDGLRHAAACPAPSHLECPSFRRLLGLATTAQRARRGRAAPAAALPAKRRNRARI